jgi:SSS family solute:Na+ symporter
MDFADFAGLVFCLFTRWFTAPALLSGWVVGLLGGTWLSWSDGLKPLHALTFGSTTMTVYVGLLALIANILVAILVNLAVRASGRTEPMGSITG